MVQIGIIRYALAIAAMLLIPTVCSGQELSSYDEAVKAFYNKDDEKVVSLLEGATAELDRRSKMLLSFVYEDRFSEKYDISKAVNILKSETADGNPMAQLNLAYLYLGEGGDYEKYYNSDEALKLIMSSKQAGYIPAHYKHALYCDFNDCITKDEYKIALELVEANPDYSYLSREMRKINLDKVNKTVGAYNYQNAMNELLEQEQNIAKFGNERAFFNLTLLSAMNYQRNSKYDQSATILKIAEWYQLAHSYINASDRELDEVVEGIEYFIDKSGSKTVIDAHGFRERYLTNELHHDLPYINWCNVNYSDKESKKYYTCLNNADGDNTGICSGYFYSRYFEQYSDYFKSKRYGDCRRKLIDNRVGWFGTLFD